MKPNQQQGWLLAGIVCCVVLAAGAVNAPAVSKYLTRVDDRVWLAGLLDMEGLRRLDPATTVIIDLRTEEEGVAEERARVEALGMAYYNVPVSGAEIVEADLARVRRLLDQSGADAVFVHCASGNRAGMIWGALLLDQGRSLAEALDAVSGVVTKASIRDALTVRAAAIAGRAAAATDDSSRPLGH